MGNDVMYKNPVLDLQAKGYRLRIPKDGSQAESVEYLGGGRYGNRVAVTGDDVQKAISGTLLFKLTEHRHGQRTGWREAGLDGDVADWYVWTQ